MDISSISTEPLEAIPNTNADIAILELTTEAMRVLEKGKAKSFEAG